MSECSAMTQTDDQLVESPAHFIKLKALFFDLPRQGSESILELGEALVNSRGLPLSHTAARGKTAGSWNIFALIKSALKILDFPLQASYSIRKGLNIGLLGKSGAGNRQISRTNK